MKTKQSGKPEAAAVVPSAAARAVELALANPTEILLEAGMFRRYPANRVPSQEAIAAMRDSILEVGQLQPITARRVLEADEEGAQAEIVAGETRWRACQAIDPEMPVRCVLLDLDDKQAARLNAIENFQRRELDPIEEARAIRNLLDNGWEMEQIMTDLNKSLGHLYDVLSLLKLDEEAHRHIREGRLPVRVGRTIAGLPEEKRAAAVEACVNPTHRDQPLSKVEALEVLDKKFIQPIKLAEEWQEKRRLAEREHPGAEWLEYEEAKAMGGWNGGHVRCEARPGWHLLCDAANADEMAVPTWGELAARHGAPVWLACNSSEEVIPVTLPEPLMEAEKAAHAGDPGSCIFRQEGGKQEQALDRERQRLEQAAAEQAWEEEWQGAVRELVARPADGFPGPKGKRVAGMVLAHLMEEDKDVLEAIFPPPPGVEREEAEELALAAAGRWVRSRENPLAAVATLALARLISESRSHWGRPLSAAVLAAGGMLKGRPLHAARHAEESAECGVPCEPTKKG